MSDNLQKPSAELIVDMINEANGTFFTVLDLTFGTPMPVIGKPRNTDLLIGTTGTTSYLGGKTINYDRLDFATLFDGETILVVDDGSIHSKVDLLLQVNDQFQLGLAAADIQDSGIDVIETYPYPVEIEAAVNSLAYTGSFTLSIVAEVSPAVFVSLPVISGVLEVGNTLTVSNGTYIGFPVPTFTYQWYQGASELVGETSNTLLATAADTYSCVVTATNSAGSDMATADAVEVVEVVSNETIARSLLNKLYTWYPMDGDTDDAWGPWPITDTIASAGSFHPTSDYGSGLSGQCVVNASKRTKLSFPDWSVSTDYFLGAFRSEATGFNTDAQAACLIQSGYNESLNMNETASGFSGRGLNGSTVYQGSSVDIQYQWTLTITEHEATGNINYHRNDILKFATVSGNATLNPFDHIQLGSSNGAAGSAGAMARMFVGKGLVAVEELQYLFNEGAGRTLDEMIIDAGSPPPTLVWSGFVGPNIASSYDGKKLAAIQNSFQQSVCNVGHSSGKWCGTITKYRASAPSVVTTIVGFADKDPNTCAGYFVLDGGSTGQAVAGTGFTLGTNPVLGAWGAGDVMDWALDADAKKIWFGKNGTFSGDPVAGTDWALSYTSTADMFLFFGLDHDNFSCELGVLAEDMPHSGPIGYLPYCSSVPTSLEQLDEVPEIVLSLEKEINTALKAIRVRRANGDELDIGFDGLGLDVTAMLTFAGGGDLTVPIWYEQQDADYDAVQPVASKQPLIVSAGTYLGKLIFDGVDDFMLIPNVYNNGSYFGLYTKVKQSVGAARLMFETGLDYNSTQGSFTVYSDTANYGIGMNDATFSSQRSTTFDLGLSTEKQLTVLWDRSQTNVDEIKAWVDSVPQTGTPGGTYNQANAFLPNDLYIGSRGGTNYFANMELSKLILYNVNTAPNRKLIEDIIA